MRILLMSIAFALMGSPVAAQSSFAADEQAIRAVVEDYFWGRQNGDQERLGRSMLVEGSDLKGVTNDGERDRLTVTPLADYVARNTRPRSQPTQARILALDIVEGRMAWAKVGLISDSEEITDYLLLYRIGADWKIVTKMFVRSPKGGAAERR